MQGGDILFFSLIYFALLAIVILLAYYCSLKASMKTRSNCIRKESSEREDTANEPDYAEAITIPTQKEAVLEQNLTVEYASVDKSRKKKNHEQNILTEQYALVDKSRKKASLKNRDKKIVAEEYALVDKSRKKKIREQQNQKFQDIDDTEYASINF